MKKIFFKKSFLRFVLAALLACCASASLAGAESHALVAEAYSLIIDNYVEEPDAQALVSGALAGMEEYLKTNGKRYPAQILSGLPFKDGAKNGAGFIGSALDGLSSAANAAPELLEEAAVRGMFKTLDAHSSYLDAAAYKDLISETKGEFVGVGMQLTLKDGEIAVIAAIEDTPAHRAGVKAGDRLVAIDGAPTKGMSINDAVKRIRGKKGTVVTLTVQRAGAAPMEFKITREQIKIKSVKYRPLGEGIGYLRVSQFQENTATDVKDALVKLGLADGALRGLVLDLRNNPGGLLSTAVDVANEFIDAGTIVYLKGRNADSNQRFEAKAGGAHPSSDAGAEGAAGYFEGKTTLARPYYPLAVLVNEGSASAAEVLSGALQDLNRGVLLGKATFGKGTVQTLYTLKNGGGMRLTTARYHFASGRAIHGSLTPDVQIEEKEGVDAPLEAARRALILTLKDGGFASNDNLRKAAQNNAVNRPGN